MILIEHLDICNQRSEMNTTNYLAVWITINCVFFICFGNLEATEVIDYVWNDGTDNNYEDLYRVGNLTDMNSPYADILSRLEPWQWHEIQDYVPEGQMCMLEFWFASNASDSYCNATWDGFLCWPATPPNTTVYQRCPETFSTTNNSTDTEALAHRTCTVDGQWNHDSWTNFTMCLLNIFLEYDDNFLSYLPYDEELALDYWKAAILRDIYFYASILSFVLLSITLFIFCFFKSLQCNRISIHKNLVVSFITRSIILIIFFEPFVTGREHSYREINWLCKVLNCILYYSVVSNIFWMFVEGLFLHNRVAISVFNTEAPFTLFYLIGWVPWSWLAHLSAKLFTIKQVEPDIMFFLSIILIISGLPALIILAWAVCMQLFNPRTCWNESYRLHYTWIIIFPIIVAVLVNMIFLINIIRILVTKLRANNTVELDRVRKAVKATMILFPLLGMTHIWFFFRPNILNVGWDMAYRVVHAVLQASQGIFVSAIYCFMNSEVRMVIMKKWRRYKSQRLGNRRGRRYSAGKTSTILLPLSTSATENGSVKQGSCTGTRDSWTTIV